MKRKISATNAVNKIIQGDCLEVLKELEDNSIDSVVTDPPYGLSFMGKKWDYDVPEVKVWKECIRVLKPGGYLLSFAGTRTYHRMAVNIEDAGLEIRDMIAWVYGSGFPKSLNIGKAVDKINGEVGRKQKFTKWMRTTGVTVKEINKLTNSFMGSHYLTTKDQPAIPTRKLWSKLRPYIKTEIPQWVDELVERIEREREVIGKQTNIANKNNDNTGRYNWNTENQTRKESIDVTKGNSPWEGWGTALKPSHEDVVMARKPIESSTYKEYNIAICQKLFASIAKHHAIFLEKLQDLHPNLEPICVARKPFKGTVAENVLKYGTGGINIDGSRVESTEFSKDIGTKRPQSDDYVFKSFDEKTRKSGSGASSNLGRFPANFIHDGSEEVERLFPNTSTHGGGKGTGKTADWNLKSTVIGNYKNDNGSASRFFYCAKASKTERNKGLEGFEKGCLHPTVKPISLMRYLVKLVTPPNGTVLDPFLGSGTTAIACKLEGFNYLGIEREEEYVKIAEARIKAWIRQNTLI